MSVIEHPSATASSSSASARRVLVIPGQGIGPECTRAALAVLEATGAPLIFTYGSLGYPDAAELFSRLEASNPTLYRAHFGATSADTLARDKEHAAKEEARALGNINEFYKRLLAGLPAEVLAYVKTMVTEAEKATLGEAARCDAVLKGALRTLDEGDEPSRNVTIRKAFEQYANIRRCVTLNPIASGAEGADILFVRENVEDLYASIEHRLARNYPQALRHQTPEGCELICRAAFEACLRDGRRKVTALEKPNILKITGGLFKEVFTRVAAEYPDITSQFMIIDDGLAAIAATPERFDVVVTSNMFGDIGSDIAAKVTGGVGLVSSNNTNPSNPRAVSMFETMGGTADDIAGLDRANPVALIDAAAEMLLHMGDAALIEAAELIKASILLVLSEGHYVGDIKHTSYQKARGKAQSTTSGFTAELVRVIHALRADKAAAPESSIKDLAMARADSEAQPLLNRVLISYQSYAANKLATSDAWKSAAKRNLPPNSVRAQSQIVGFDMFVDDSGMQRGFTQTGDVDAARAGISVDVVQQFTAQTGIIPSEIVVESAFGSLQSLRSFVQYMALRLGEYLASHPALASGSFNECCEAAGLGDVRSMFSAVLQQKKAGEALRLLQHFSEESIKLIQAFYLCRAAQITPILAQHGFMLVRITSRGTEIYPTMGDFEKRDIDRYRVEIAPGSPLASQRENMAAIQQAIFKLQQEVAALGWVIAETMLNRSFIDAEGSKKGKLIPGVSRPYAMGLGTHYALAAADAGDAPRLKRHYTA